ncbi:MAG: hypothetical protein R3F39_23065 [Myxococcota bacterium]
MASQAAERATALVRRYLDPGRSWDAGLDAELRGLLREDDAARAVYRRAVTAHRLMASGSAEAPSGFEERRMMDAVVGAVAAPARQGAARGIWSAIRWPALGVAVAAGLALLLVQPPGLVGEVGGEVGDPTLRARGGEVQAPLVGLGISGVTEGGAEYEVVASGEAFLGDWVRFYTSNDRADISYVFVVGLQPDRPVAWYAPLPPEETQSLPIPVERHHMLPMENKLAARHEAGPLRVVALFTGRPLDADVVGRVLTADLSALVSSELESALRERLALGAGDVVQILETRVVPGKQKETSRE